MTDSEDLKDNKSWRMPPYLPCGRQNSWFFLGNIDLGEIADGTEKCPTEPAEKKKWILKENKVNNYVLKTVDKKVKPNIIHCVHGNDMSLKLQTLYKRYMPEKIEQLMKDCFSFKFIRSTDIATNISDLQNIAFEINRLKPEKIPYSDLI